MINKHKNVTIIQISKKVISIVRTASIFNPVFKSNLLLQKRTNFIKIETISDLLIKCIEFQKIWMNKFKVNHMITIQSNKISIKLAKMNLTTINTNMWPESIKLIKIKAQTTTNKHFKSISLRWITSYQ